MCSFSKLIPHRQGTISAAKVYLTVDLAALNWVCLPDLNLTNGAYFIAEKCS